MTLRKICEKILGYRNSVRASTHRIAVVINLCPPKSVVRKPLTQNGNAYSVSMLKSGDYMYKGSEYSPLQKALTDGRTFNEHRR